MTTFITRRAARALAAAAISLPILAGAGLSFAQGTPAPAPAQAAPAAPAAPAGSPAPARETTALGDLRDMSRIAVSGRVAEVFGNKFVIEDASGRALVDLGPSGDDKPMVAPGEAVTVEGRFDRGSVRAAALVHADGRRDAMREPRGPGRDGPGREGPGRDGPRNDDGPRGEGRHGGPGKHHRGPHDGGPRGDGPRADDDRRSGGVLGWFSGGGVDEAAATKVLTDAGYTDVALLDEGRHHAEFRAKDAAGQDWRLAVGDDNALREREPFRVLPTEDEARMAVERLGYTYDGDYEAHREHVEVAAKTREGQSLTVELNTDGSLRKERFED